MKNKIIAACGVFTVGFVIGLTVVYALLSDSGTPQKATQGDPSQSTANVPGTSEPSATSTANQMPKIIETKKSPKKAAKTATTL